MNAGEYTQACGLFLDQVGEKTIRHIGQPELDAAVRGARPRPLVDRWAWSRTRSMRGHQSVGGGDPGGLVGVGEPGRRREHGDLVKLLGWLKRQTDPGQERLEVQRGWFEAELAGWQGWYGLSPQAAERVWVANRCIHLNANQISSMELKFETSAPAGK